MIRRVFISAFVLASAALAAQPTIGTVTLSPTFAPAGVPTQVTLTAVITDPSMVANGANVQRLNSAGTATAVLGIMHDDGLNGDLVAGDGIFTLVFTLNEPATGRVLLRASGSFQGVSARVPSSGVAVDIGPGPTPLAIDATVFATPNLAGWFKQDVPVAFACTGGAGGSVTCPGTVVVSTEGSAQAVTQTQRMDPITSLQRRFRSALTKPRPRSA